MTSDERGGIDVDRLIETLVSLVRTPSSVPPGATEVLPGDATIVEAVEGTWFPLVDALGPDEVRRHPAGDVVARFGPPGDDGLLIQTYVVSQHGNLMGDPTLGQVVDGASLGIEGPCVVGQGANQNKGPAAAVLAAVAALPRDLSRPVWLAINTEGRSSHGGSRRLLEELEVRAASCVVSIGTDLAVSIGNRGRVDVVVTVPGASCHSSQPWLGDNPIEAAADVVAALRGAPLPEPDPLLGAASAVPFQVRCEPLAPHTIPERAVVVVDRRLLPGETPDDAVASLRDHLGANVPHALRVEAGEHMLPSTVARDAPVVAALTAAVRELTERARGDADGTVVSRNTFDAGLASSRGIETCMFGPGRRDFGHGVTRTEAVGIEDCRVAAEALRRASVLLCA